MLFGGSVLAESPGILFLVGISHEQGKVGKAGPNRAVLFPAIGQHQDLEVWGVARSWVRTAPGERLDSIKKGGFPHNQSLGTCLGFDFFVWSLGVLVPSLTL